MTFEVSSAGGYWRCFRNRDLEVRHWEDGTVVFDDRGAFLHLLSPVAGECIEIVLKGGNVDAAQVALALLKEDPLQADIEQVDSLLEELRGMELIERLHR